MHPAKAVPLAASVLCVLAGHVSAADAIQSKSTYAKSYGETKGAVTVDPAKDLPRYPAVEPKDAIATWQVKKGFHLELAANEPQVRSPVAISYDERGRMFACEMIDYSEMRDVTPHLGRVSMLEDKDGDGHFETSTVFADDLAWPTGLICANGGVFVIATPDLWFFKDTNGDGKADVREKVFTGFGTGLKLLNVQGLANSPMWGQDNRIHILAGGGNRGVMTCLKRPDLKGVELGGKDFWFDPRTFEFGLEAGGAQYGMSFDNYGRKFGCSNSDHLQYWVYDDKYAGRDPYFQMPPSRQSIAVDGGAAEVFRISPDEPWRIIRTRWRIAGVVKGAVEGGGRVSGYFTGATGTTIFRGDAYGPEFLNNSFSGDAGGQLVHRKIIRPTADGISLEGERPADERGFEFAASKDTWVRVVNFANAPDGCMNIIDMYREVIEHPWSIPDEIKKHLDLNSGKDRGRIYRIVKDGWKPGADRRGKGVNLADMSTEELVNALGHPNGWHRDTAQRLLYERNDKSAIPLLEKVLEGNNALAKIYALGALKGAGALSNDALSKALGDSDAKVAERACSLSEDFIAASPKAADQLVPVIVKLTAKDRLPRTRYQAALTLGTLGYQKYGSNADALDEKIVNALTDVVRTSSSNAGLVAAVASARATVIHDVALRLLNESAADTPVSLIEILASMPMHGDSTSTIVSKVSSLSGSALKNAIRALATGFKRAGTSIEKADTSHKLAAVFATAAVTTADTKATEAARLEAIELLGLTSSADAAKALEQCLGEGQPDAIQSAALKTLAQHSSAKTTKLLLDHWPHYGAKTKAATLDAFLARDDRAIALLEANVMKPADFSATQVQALVHHKNDKVASLAKTVLASVIPPSREEVVAKLKPALTMKGDATRGAQQYAARCIACHRANGQGIQVGPDLVTVKTKGREALFTAILEPHKEVAPQFIAYTVNTKDGQTLSGIVTKDDASSMTLKLMGGAEVNVQRANIKGSSSSGQSLMPEGIEAGLDPQGMADLLDFIEAVK
ncbi:MAG: c-type cytochrome [Verrucomicrobiaceae bacterium]|nr:c-type cytochrome [Verrucomicrobiaceae bacterium]